MRHRARKQMLQRWLVTMLLLALLAIGVGYIYLADQLSVETLGALGAGRY